MGCVRWAQVILADLTHLLLLPGAGYRQVDVGDSTE